jgi:hypothetical protein
VNDTQFLYQNLKTTESVSDRIFIILRGHLCHIIVLNIHAPTVDKTDVKDGFYEELEHMFDKFTKYRMIALLGDVNTKVGRKTFSNLQLRMKVYTKLVLIMGSE